MQKLKLNKKIVITGGGSGGHVSVALSILGELEKRYNNTKEMVSYIGGDLAMVGDKSAKSIEEKRMEGRGYRFYKLRAGKLQRYLSFETIRLLFRSILGFFDAMKYLQHINPDIVISTGGFVSVPVAIASYIFRKPLFIHEQTAAVGLTNKISGYIAKKIFVTFPESLKYFPKEKTKVIGNPIRKEIFEINTGTPLLDHLELMKKEKSKYPIIYISGGGLGSHVINTAIRDSLLHILNKYQLILQTGDNQTFRDFDVLKKEQGKLPKEKRERIYITKFVTDFEIGAVFNTVDMYMGRSGANTVYELGVLGIPSILIPIPWVTHNEQELNAKVLVNMGIGTILREGNLSRESLINSIDNFYNSLNQKERLIDRLATNSVEILLDEINI